MNGRFCIGIVISFAGLSPHSFSHHPDVPATNALGSSQTETSITVGIAALEAVLSLRHQKGCTTWAGSSRRNFLGASQQAGGSCRRRLTLNLDEDMTRKLVISSSRPVVQSTPRGPQKCTRLFLCPSGSRLGGCGHG